MKRSKKTFSMANTIPFRLSLPEKYTPYDQSSLCSGNKLSHSKRTAACNPLLETFGSCKCFAKMASSGGITISTCFLYAFGIADNSPFNASNHSSGLSLISIPGGRAWRDPPTIIPFELTFISVTDSLLNRIALLSDI